MSNFFQSKRTTPEYDVAMDPYGPVRNKLVGWLSGIIGQPAEQYSGEFVAPMSEEEELSLEKVGEYGAAELPDIFTAGREEISKTLSGGYDPTTSPYYQAVKAEAARNLGDVQEDISSRAAGGGRYWSGARLGEQQEASTDVALGLNRLLGELSETERERKFRAAPLAGEFAKYEEEFPLRQAGALQTFGSLPRLIQQARDEAVYREWLRATQEYPLNVGQLAAGVQQEPYYAQVGYQPSRFRRMMEGIMSGQGPWGAFD